MKRFLFSAVILATLSLSTGCSKDAVVEEPISDKDTIVDIGPIADPAIATTGIVAGKVMPETKFSLQLYNDTENYIEYVIQDRTGVFVIRGVKAGEYTLFIQPEDPSLNPVTLNKIAVDTSRTTNLGLIFLP